MSDNEITRVGTALSLIDRLEYKELVPDPAKPGYVMDPETGRKWRTLQPTQARVAEYIFSGCNYREACRKAGVKHANPNSLTSYVTNKLRTCQPFINYLIELYLEARRSQSVTLQDHLKRLEDLGRRAEKAGRYSAAVSAEVARGRAAGLYTKEDKPVDPRVLNSLRDIDSRIMELLEKQEKDKGKAVVSEQ